MAPARWQRYTRGFDTYRPQIRPTAPAATRDGWATTNSPRSGSARVLWVKSELHLNQDGVKDRGGHRHPAGADLFTQIITETGAGVVFTIGTAASVFDEFQLGDVVVTRATTFR